MQLTISAEAKKTQRNFHHAREFFLKTMLASIVLLSLVVFQKSNPPLLFEEMFDVAEYQEGEINDCKSVCWLYYWSDCSSNH